MRIVVVFPGQGSQYPKMGTELARDFPAAASILSEIDCAVERIVPSFNLKALMETASEQELQRTDLCQAFVFAHSLMAQAAFDQQLKLRKSNYMPVAALGHSFGELTAHVSAGSLEAARMSALVFRRGNLIIQTAPAGALLNIERVKRRQLEKLIAEFCSKRGETSQVYVAIQQAPRLYAVGGLEEAVADFEAFLQQHGIDCRPIVGVNRALHTPLQAEARFQFQGILERIPFRAPHFPVVSTARGAFHVPGEAPKELAAQLDSEMRFCKSLKCVANLEPDFYIIFGSGSKIAELLAHYNGVPASRVRVVERSAQVYEVAQELFGGSYRSQRRMKREARRRGCDFAKHALRGFQNKREEYLLIEPNGHMSPLAEALGRTGTLIFFKGSFNPIHLGHVELYEASRRRHPGSLGAFALSVQTNKGVMQLRSLLFRARVISRAGYPVVLSYSGYFSQNVSWLREYAPGLRLVFPLGVDVLRRLIEYYSPDEFRDKFKDVIFEYSVRDIQSKLFTKRQWHPAYRGTRQLDLDATVRSLSSSKIRTLAAAGKFRDVRSHMPIKAAEVFERRWKGAVHDS